MSAHPEINNPDIAEVRSPSDAQPHSARPFFAFSLFHRPLSLFRLPLPFSERRLLLIGLDLLAINAALLLALALRPEHSLDWELLIQRPLWFLLLSILWLPLAYAFDAYDLRVAGRLSTAAPAVLKAGAITAVVYLLIPYLPPALPGSRLSLFTFFLFTFFLLLAGRGLYVLALAQPYFGRRALIIGAGWAGRTMVTGRQGEGEKGGWGEGETRRQEPALSLPKGEGGQEPALSGAKGARGPCSLSPCLLVPCSENTALAGL